VILLIERDIYSPVSTMGVLTVDGVWAAWTMERPWMYGANTHGISAILEGIYPVTLYESPRWAQLMGCAYPVLRLANVPGRDAIEIHPANVPSQLEGCIAVGSARFMDRIEDSRRPFEALRERVRIALQDEPVLLRIQRKEMTSDNDDEETTT
jgi:hypothetical protein